MYRNVMVPLDGTKFGEHALPLALDVARKAGAVLRLAHVHRPASSVLAETPPEEDSGVTAGPENERTKWQRYLDKVAARLREAEPSVGVVASLREGEPAEALEEEVGSAGVDLVVMTTHTSGVQARAMLGSVTDQLLRHVAVPFLLTRPGEGKSRLNSEGLPPEILVALDGSPSAEQVLRPAAELGKLVSASYTLVRAVKPEEATATPAPEAAGSGPAAAAATEPPRPAPDGRLKEAVDYLERTAGPLRAGGLRVATHATPDEQPAVAILQRAAALGPCVVALTTHGRPGVVRVAPGSVAGKVVRGSRYPVLVLRPAA